MKTWTQVDDALNPIKTWGCYFISLANLAGIVLNKEFSAKEILDSWAKNYYVDHDIDQESTILNPDKVMEDFGVISVFVGKKPADYQCKSDEYEILKYFNPKTGTGHFVLGDGKGKCLFDPYPNSATVRDGYLDSKRIFKVVK